MADSYNEPLAREDHSTVRVGNYLYMWVGNQENLPEVHNNEEKKRITSRIERFNLLTGQWEHRTTTGDPPLATYGYATAVIGNEIFYFGGHCTHGGCWHNSLYSLNVTSLQWRELSPTHTESTGSHPSMKDCCGMVPIQIDGDYYLVVFGGWGSSCQQPGAQYENGFNNEVHYFELATGQWISPEVIGDRPPPCSRFTLTSITDNSAILFGGWTYWATDHVYIAQFTKTSVAWNKLVQPSIDEAIWPSKRSSHCSVLVDAPAVGPHLLVIGGFVSDCWILDIEKEKWTRLDLPRSAIERERHSLTLWKITPTTSWIIQFGGRRKNEKKISKTIVIELRYCDGKWFVNTIHLDEYQEKLRKECHYNGATYNSGNTTILQSAPNLTKLMDILCQEPGIQNSWQSIAITLGVYSEDLSDAKLIMSLLKLSKSGRIEYLLIDRTIWKTIIDAIEYGVPFVSKLKFY